MYYIFVINTFEIGSNSIEAKEILDSLLTKKIWLYNLNIPNFTKIKVGDNVLIYVAGPGRRFFTAKFTIASEIFKHSFYSANEKEDLLFKSFKYASYIENIEIFKDLINISEIKEKLRFIKDKKHYGLFFRQATRLISEEDYRIVLDHNKVINK
ncbi:EVE domain-containing protein [Priestia megaterium]|uniref:EVE domain-containing protein n=1 Tax=Priestia megaterium TaxID=1404 RepID=UPI00119E35B4|nr:EVE domain-containing protein [Priestia megaterium]